MPPARRPDRNSVRRLLTQASPGLSLIEVLVTLAIVGAATGMIVLTMVPPDPARTEFERVRQSVEAVAERAVISGTPSGIRFSETGYEPVIWQGGEWRAIPRQARTLPSGVSLTLRDDSRTRRTGPDDKDWPGIIFDPLGHTTTAELTVRHGRQELTLSLTADGVETAGTRR
ncbi:MAG: prepilin-type N-terminal cleavage/methylation domain-containing protein [Hyphomonas sp.]